MDAQPQARNVLRDYFAGPGSAKVVPLVDYETGAAKEEGMLARVGTRIVRANNQLYSVLGAIPGQFKDNWDLLRDPVQFRLLMRSLVDDSLLTARRRKAIVSILLFLVLAAGGAVTAVLAIYDAELLVVYQSGWSLFMYSLATSLFLPTPFEWLLDEGAASLGTWPAILVAAVGKVIGSWLVLMLGDRANEGLEQLMNPRRAIGRAFHWMMRVAQRWGFVAVFVLFAIPFMPDTGPLLFLALLKMRKSIFLGVMFVAVLVRSLVYLSIVG